MIMFRMCPTKKGKTGRTPQLLFPNHLLRLVDNFDQISMSYFRAHNIVTYERNGGGVMKEREKRPFMIAGKINTSLSCYNISCNGADPVFQKGIGGALVIKNIYSSRGYKVQFFLGLEIHVLS